MKTATQSTFPTWKTVTVGNLGSAQEARKRLEDAGIRIGDWGDDILERATFEDTETPLDLVRVLVKELGLEDGATTAQIYAAAESHNLSLCPAEAAPQLWLHDHDLLPRGEWSLVAMETIVDSGGDRNVFRVVCDDFGRWIYARNGHPDRRWDSNVSWMFVRNPK